MARIQELTLNGSNRGLLLIALAAGLIAAAVVFIVLNDNDSDSSGGSSAGGDVAAVVVAAQDIAVGAEITPEMVRLQEIPLDLTIAGTLSESELVVGEVARVAMAQGEQITNAKLGVPVPDKGLAGVVPAGMRGVALEVSEVTAVGGLLLPGDRVDILSTTTIERAPGLAEDENILRTETILQNVEVLSVAQEAQQASGRPAPDESAGGASNTSGQIPDDVEEQPGAGTITLALSLVDAEKLANAQEHADRVWAVLRPYGDDSIADVTPHDTVIVDSAN